ncbi:PDZ domain-containing protein [Tuwongella immobilis]|uniref:PDZ domain-containing protein n=1 Tax=Tuwongella immobilis TaxID=692036 RepID=A0A6C2YKA5_9BACT|nr:PDZ domain-containing protein [Tuwongella immobilis]VIP01731.1 pdz dhr glgf domain-containing protein : PDZ/DHR/GLGF domain protein OS=Isosphaera pallida (strain ATCC 43644 / DSM 9630 / IS1B) GN=Isop_0235 PE=4 SV=1: Asp_protease_2: PDZ_2 [Tuwongella immobilis]VTR99281.1 pdz dhr glgf domain-containing protein : PDZ/DHR/GLGF domain protein OS=Isosphaera pallida (strain ATCC 43644 / DSM 9630 / IS1B) GN=Isop_0235 PE=4 SV=1: Asp_protease_2: PDZ_2 [Tuwongella immobilis]
MTRTYWTLLAVFGLLIGTPTATLRADAESPTVIPFTFVESGHFLVKVKLNGKGPYQLIFDTGAPTMLINNRIARDSGVVTPKTPKPFFAPFGALGEFPIKLLEIGQTEAENIKAMVVDHPTVELFSKVFEPKYGKIDGIVGFPFFARYRMTVDYQAKTLTMVPSGYQPKNLNETIMLKLMGGNRGPNLVAPAGQWGVVVAKASDDSDAGVVVEQVYANSPAAKAGLKVGDRLLTLDGRWTDSVEDCYRAVASLKPGKAVTATVERNGNEQAISITPRSGY